MSGQLALNCLVHGDRPGQVFTVKIAGTKNVSVLRDAIKEKTKPLFDAIPANHLVLWQVSISADTDELLVEELKHLVFDDKKPLSPLEKLAEVFSNISEDSEDLHVVIRAPTLAPQPLLELNCLVLGDESNHIFPVKIAKTESVGMLRKAVKEKSPLFDAIPANHLVLWKVSLPVDEILQAGLTGRGFVGKEPLSPVERLSKTFSDIPVDSNLHIVVKRPVTPRSLYRGIVGIKRTADEDDHKRKHMRTESRDLLLNVDANLLGRWATPLPSPPSLDDLRNHIMRPLDEAEKVPVSGRVWRRFSAMSFPTGLIDALPELALNQLYRISEEEEAPNVERHFATVISQVPPPEWSTEDGFHCFWDTIIRATLTLTLDINLSIRNSNNTETGSLGPNFGFLLHSLVCVLRGEEKRVFFAGTHPRQELINKTRWLYDPAEYVLGYYAIGTSVWIVAITPVHDSRYRKENPNNDEYRKVTVTDLVHLDLSTPQGRLYASPKIIRLAGILPSLGKVIKLNVDADMIPITREDGKVIEFFPDKIRKTYLAALPNRDQRLSALVDIYSHLQRYAIPHVDKMVKHVVNHPVLGTYIDLTPRGISDGPCSLSDVVNAVHCILVALKGCHSSDPPLFHRDIRWPNVIRNASDQSQWLLIDWEDAAFSPTTAARHLSATNHCPTVFQNNHGTEVDIWGVGELILTAELPLPQQLEDLGRRMKSEIQTAETALGALDDLQQRLFGQ